MKKTLNRIFSSSIILVLILSNTNFIYADSWWECKIEETPKYIEEYIENVRKVVANVNSSLSKNNNWSNVSRIDYINSIYWNLNSHFSWLWFELDSEYSVQENEQEIPDQIKRDIKILKDENEKLKLTNLSSINTQIPYDEICNGVSNDICIFNEHYWEKSLAILSKLKNSTKKLEKLLQNQATDIDLKDKDGIILFSKENFDSLYVDYSKTSLQNCSKIEDTKWNKWFFWQVIEAINNIGWLAEKSTKAISLWKESISTLWWNSDDIQNKNRQRESLAESLKKQGIGWDWSTAIIQNNETYNSDWTLLSWDFWFLNSIKNQINAFDETIKSQFPDLSSDTHKATKEILNKIWKVRDEEKEILTINSEYLNLKNISLNDDISNDTYINRLINIHLSLSEIINTLNKTCEIALIVCNSQKKWEWDCWSCN